MGVLKRISLIVLVAGSCVGCDQVTKGIAKSGLLDSNPVSLFGDTIQLQYEENHGGMLSLGVGLSPEGRFLVLTVFVGICLFGFLLFAIMNHMLRLPHIVGLSLVVGGGLGNLLDRLTNNGAVIDFLILEIGSVRTAVFNLADVAIVIGFVSLLLSIRIEQKV